MSQPRVSTQRLPLISDASVRNTLRRELHRAISIEKNFTRSSLASESRVSTDIIDGIISRDPKKHNRLKMDDVLSLIVVLGTRAVNALAAHTAHGAYPLDETGEPDCAGILADGMGHLATLARIFADGRLDDAEAEEAERAADSLIDVVTPISSRRLHA